MPVPLLWIGAGVAAYCAGQAYKEYQQESAHRVKHFPGDSTHFVRPRDGALVCCGIFGVFEHTGIWVDDSIIELKGNGLVRAVSPERFVANRSGEEIYLLCDDNDEPLIDAQTIARAMAQLYTYHDYHVINNNCHRFVWKCITGKDCKLTRFTDLNHRLHAHFGTRIRWHKARV